MNSPDHRTRVAAEKRQRMHRRLVESALQVFAQHGVESAVIDDVIAAAGVSRGTFYNYFRTHEDLVGALQQAVDNELLALVDAVVQASDDPALRISHGVRMTLHALCRHRLLARFYSRVSGVHALTHSLALQYLPRDLEAGLRAGRFAVASVDASLAVALGTTYAAACTLAQREDQASDYPEAVAFHVLLALGMPADEARALTRHPLPVVDFPPDSLLARTLTPNPA